MPKAFQISSTPQGGSAKRQRSADSRDSKPKTVPVGQDSPGAPSSKSNKAQLRPNVKMPAYLEKSQSEILATFQEVEWQQRFRLFHAMENPEISPYKVDRSDVVVGRNRYTNVQPWDASRIKLQTPIAGSDYVNASPIVLQSRGTKSSEGTEESAAKQVRYIATQGPKQGQLSHFWHMVHQETTGDVGVMIMLTKLIEDNKEKCAQYYPLDLENPTMTLQHDESSSDPGESAAVLGAKSNPDTSTSSSTRNGKEPVYLDTVTLITKDFDDDVGCEVRKLRLTINNQEKTIVHYLFSRWPDFGKPEAADRRALIQLSRRSFGEAGDSPRVVHCSAGVGRTGTWIALDFLIREVEEGRLFDNVKVSHSSSSQENNGSTSEAPKSLETWGKSGPPMANTPTHEDGFDKDEHDLIYETVNTLREQRMMMVVRDVQFIFLYEAVREAVLEKYKAKPEGAIVTGGEDGDIRPPRTKSRRVSEEGVADETVSEAETEIMDVDSRRQGSDDENDPYAAVSPATLRRGISH